jgi:hypothetical protein
MCTNEFNDPCTGQLSFIVPHKTCSGQEANTYTLNTNNNQNQPKRNRKQCPQIKSVENNPTQQIIILKKNQKSTNGRKTNTYPLRGRVHSSIHLQVEGEKKNKKKKNQKTIIKTNITCKKNQLFCFVSLFSICR